jgi:hypothetical protein
MSGENVNTQPWSNLAEALCNINNVLEADAAIKGLPLTASGAKAVSKSAGDAAARRLSTAPEPDSVGIWRRTVVNGEIRFVRPEGFQDPLHLWADAPEIGPKRTQRRVVFIGESAARGWPLDPCFNCASCLSKQLDHLPGKRQTEVIDLARCGIDSTGLAQMVAAACGVEPDAYVVFAGNNWDLDPGDLDFRVIADILRNTRSWRAVISYVEGVYRSQIDAILSSLFTEIKRQGIPTVFVIPGYNLRDWRIGKSWYNPLLDRESQGNLEQTRLQVEALIASKQTSQAASTANELLEREERISPCALHLLADCALAEGANSEAVALLETAWNSGLNLLVPQFSGFTIRCDQMRLRAAAEGITTVDLPRHFVQANGGVPPGREFFIDQIHMTSHGIRVAMAAIADQLANLLHVPSSSVNLAEVPVEIDGRATAQGHFAAALKSARNGQSRELVQYHAKCAVHAAPEIHELMRLYVNRTVHRSPDPFCKSAHALRALDAQFPVIRYFLNAPPQKRKRVELDLFRDFAAAVELHYPGAVAETECLIGEQLGIRSTPIDLLVESGEDLPLAGIDWTRFHRAYFAAYEVQTAGKFVWNTPGKTLRLRITSRVRNAAVEAKAIALVINNRQIQTWPATQQWSTWECRVPTEVVKDGDNTFAISWPVSGESKEDQIEKICRLVEAGPSVGMGVVPDLYTVYGEVHELLAWCE